MMPAFDFVEEYRALQPSQTRELIEARQSSFQKLTAAANKHIARVLDLARIAYGIPHPTESDAEAWFDEIVKSSDSTFSVKYDGAEAALIAALVLRNRLASSFAITSVVVHAAAFAGKRLTPDKGALSLAARTAIEEIVRARGATSTLPQITTAKAIAIPPLIEKYQQDHEIVSNVQALEALHKDYVAQLTQIVSSANSAVSDLHRENRRLAEEVDLLWWYLGRHSLLLDRSIESIDPSVRPIVIGMDLAKMVNQPPGPFGVYGIIRQALGELADTPVKFSEAIKSLKPDHGRLVSSAPIANYGLAPVFSATAEALHGDGAPSSAQFKKKTGLSFETKLTGYELAIQAYHEGLLYNLEWVR